MNPSRPARPGKPITATALLLAICLATLACTGNQPGPSSPASTPAPSPVASGEASADPGDSPSPGDAGADNLDVGEDPVPPSPSLPAFSPPPLLSPSAATAGLVLHVPILMYHRIVPPAQAGNSLPGLVVPPELFAAQMDTLASAGWHTITAAQLVADLAAGTRPGPRTFVITFDDGYDDGYTYALPILQAHGFVASYYVIAGRIGNPPGPDQALTPGHVQALVDAGMEIGNHTVHHVNLTRFSGAALTYQVSGASARIAELVGSAPTTLAYPFGRWNLETETAVRDAGMDLGLTTVEGARETWATRYATPRVRVSPSTSPAKLLALVSRAWP